MLTNEQTMKARTATKSWSERFAAAKFGSPEYLALCKESSAGIKDLVARQRAAEVKRASSDWLTANPAEAQPAALPTKQRIVYEGGLPIVKSVVDLAAIAAKTIGAAKTADGKPSQQVHH